MDHPKRPDVRLGRELAVQDRLWNVFVKKRLWKSPSSSSSLILKGFFFRISDCDFWKSPGGIHRTGSSDLVWTLRTNFENYIPGFRFLICHTLQQFASHFWVKRKYSVLGKNFLHPGKSMWCTTVSVGVNHSYAFQFNQRNSPLTPKLNWWNRFNLAIIGFIWDFVFNSIATCKTSGQRKRGKHFQEEGKWRKKQIYQSTVT